MIKLTDIQYEDMVVHRVGNKHRAERNFESRTVYGADEQLQDTLLHYFIRPFKRVDDHYRFRHSSDLTYNEVYGFASAIFDEPSRLLPESVNILHHLYRQSDHPNIKSGELYVVHFRDVQVDDELVDAIGIFKSERKHAFLKVREEGERLRIRRQEGISVDKLDKGCLILNVDREEGFLVLSIDNNSYDADYWLHHFLNVDFIRNESFHTRSYLELCNAFSKEVIIPAKDKQEQIKFLSNSVDYFNSNDQFSVDEFTQKVVPEGEMQEEFRNYQRDFALDGVEHFEISQKALRSARRKIKDSIKLDTNIQIKLDFNNPDASNRFLEKGYDEQRGMFFYKVYFNEELP
ncbi:MAG: nucleoid-associated protein [Bacteroidota bacterium]